MRRLAELVGMSAWLLFALSCGGAAGGASDQAPRAGGSGAEALGSEQGGGEARAGGRCDDGGCVECGEGLCLMGAYCEYAADETAGCSWSEACPERPTCECLRPTLDPGCTCEAQGSAVTVRCQ